MKYIDIERRTVAITTLRADSFSAKPAKLDEDCRALRAYYHDASSGATMARLAALGMGIADNTRPAEISLLRWVIDQLAVAYANAPTRWLIGGNSKRLAESNADIVAMRRTLKALTLRSIVALRRSHACALRPGCYAVLRNRSSRPRGRSSVHTRRNRPRSER